MAKESTAEKVDTASIREDLDQLRADFAALAKTLQAQGQAKAGDVADRVAGAYGSAKEAGNVQVENLQHTIETRPFTSVAVAFVVGLLTGKLLDRTH